MKKVLCFAAAAMALFAACQKTTVVYDNGGQQEIAFFAVNKTATKAPVSNTTFPETYAMQVAAYLADGDGVATGGEDYFNKTKFEKSTTYWTGGQYWPLSAATLNFLAVAPQIETPVAPSTTTVTTVFNATSKFASKSVTTVANNESDQYDVMYSAARAEKDAGTAPGEVDMTFSHAYSWLVFNFKQSENAPEIIITDIEVNDVSCNGTLTVNVANADKASGDLTTTQDWDAFTSTDLTVPADADLTVNTGYQSYSNGLLVIPDDPMSGFVITYTIDGHEFTYTYTPSPAPTWDPGKKYIFNINMSPSLISIEPEVEVWDDTDEKGTPDTSDDEPWGEDVILG